MTSAYGAAKGAGLRSDAYAATIATEEWADGVQSYFAANASSEPADGIHNAVERRAELLAHDPDLHDLVAEVSPVATIDVPCT